MQKHDLSLRLSEEIIQELKRIKGMETKTLNDQVEAALKEWQLMMDSGRREWEKQLRASDEFFKAKKAQIADKPLKPTLVRRAPETQR
jgi:predicted HNH restriction endonuclease